MASGRVAKRAIGIPLEQGQLATIKHEQAEAVTRINDKRQNDAAKPTVGIRHRLDGCNRCRWPERSDSLCIGEGRHHCRQGSCRTTWRQLIADGQAGHDDVAIPAHFGVTNAERLVPFGSEERLLARQQCRRPLRVSPPQIHGETMHRCS